MPAVFFDFFLVLFGLVFTAFSGAIIYIGRGIRSDVHSVVRELNKQSQRLSEYMTQTEARLAVVEDRLMRDNYRAG